MAFLVLVNRFLHALQKELFGTNIRLWAMIPFFLFCLLFALNFLSFGSEYMFLG